MDGSTHKDFLLRLWTRIKTRSDALLSKTEPHQLRYLHRPVSYLGHRLTDASEKFNQVPSSFLRRARLTLYSSAHLLYFPIAAVGTNWLDKMHSPTAIKCGFLLSTVSYGAFHALGVPLAVVGSTEKLNESLVDAKQSRNESRDTFPLLHREVGTARYTRAIAELVANAVWEDAFTSADLAANALHFMPNVPRADQRLVLRDARMWRSSVEPTHAHYGVLDGMVDTLEKTLGLSNQAHHLRREM